MRSLLDVNVLIALMDIGHAHHESVQNWWRKSRNGGWASCAITENGFVRVVSNPSYRSANRIGPDVAIETLARFVANTDHEFWSDAITIRDEVIFDRSRIHGPSQLTDLYLLALAGRHNAQLVTLDGRISTLR